VEDGGARVSQGGEPRAAGRSLVRSWSVRRSEREVVVAIWCTGTQKLLCAIACLIVAAPAVLLASQLVGAVTSTPHWIATLGYSVVVLAAVTWVLSSVGSETARLGVNELRVRSVGLLGWVPLHIETGRGAEVCAATGPMAELTTSISVVTAEHRLDFGRWLSRSAAESIAEHLREAIHSPPERAPAPTGIVRRIARYRDSRTPVGAENLIGSSLQRCAVTRGVLRWGPPALSSLVGPIAVAVVVGVVATLVGPGKAAIPLFVGALVLAVSRRLVDRRSTAPAEAHADTPWTAVPYWRSRIVVLPVWVRGAPALVFLAVGLAAVAALFLVVGPMPPVARSILGAGAGLWCVVWAYRLQNVVFLGTTEVRLRELPLPSRNPVVLDFAVGRRGAHFESINFVLSRVVEVKVAGKLSGTDPSWVGISHWGEYELPDDQPPPGPGEQVEARFSLPADASGTDLTRTYPVYWMLEVTGQTSCGHYSERFPIPIYDVGSSTDAA